ncbi:MAG: hypothetical protein IT265_12110 [Saprospiraceae bacterium]|nr:hypothetical protein [Saprospiraceae bacterium]
MNSMFKILAFLLLLCLNLGVNAQTRPATVTADGLIILDATANDVAPEYVADISRFGLASYQQAINYFQKYINVTSTRGITYTFDLNANEMHIFVNTTNQFLVPLSNVPLTVNKFNEALRQVHEGLLN